ncbi:MAG: RNase P subunit p30 family protein [Candidatus Aenigmatarchaeota archaeon]
MIDAVFYNNDLEKIITISKDYKYLIIVEYFEKVKSLEEFDKKVKFEKNVISGIILRDLNEIKKISNVKNRRKIDLVFVEGGNLKVNREAVENVFIDFLINPFQNREDAGIDHIFAKKAKKNQVGISINFNNFEIKRAYQVAKLCRKYKVPLAVFSFAKNFYEFKDYKSMEALLYILGYEENEIAQNRKLIINIIEENLKKRSKDWIRPGVELI